MKVFEMFSGVGGASFALKKAGIDFECVGFSEIDKFAIKCYEQNHKGKNYGDCTKINPIDLPNFDLLTGGFPCQSFSVAGKGLGEIDTRGTLFNDIIRIAEIKKPKYCLLENVKGLTTKRHTATFEKIRDELDRIGYYVHVRILNSKEHGIPQNRERVFFVCFRKDLTYKAYHFKFPEKEELKIFLKDILEKEVDEKYYLKDEQTKKLLSTGWKQKEISNTVRSGGRQSLNKKHTWDIVQINNPTHSNNRVYSDKGVSPSLNTMQGGNRQPFILASRGRNPTRPGDRTPGIKTEQRLEPRFDGASNTITSVQKDNYVGEPVIIQRPRGFNKGGLKKECPTIGSNYWQQNNFLFNNCRIRKLTPTECFRLQGFSDGEINLEGLSNTQRYKLAGNGWDVNLVSKIFKEMFR